jgi:hypothetical protein
LLLASSLVSTTSPGGGCRTAGDRGGWSCACRNRFGLPREELGKVACCGCSPVTSHHASCSLATCTQEPRQGYVYVFLVFHVLSIDTIMSSAPNSCCFEELFFPKTRYMSMHCTGVTNFCQGYHNARGLRLMSHIGLSLLKFEYRQGICFHVIFIIVF